MAETVPVHVFVCVSRDVPAILRLLRSLLNQSDQGFGKIGSINLIWNTSKECFLDSSAELSSWVRMARSPIPIKNHHEENHGIPFARNEALRIAQEMGIERLLFIDDDCVADPALVQALNRTLDETGAEVVAGGWEIEPEGDVSSWLPLGVFGVKHYKNQAKDSASGATLQTAFTRNVLIDLGKIRQLRPDPFSFDVSLRTIGGSDVVFFFEVSHAGGKIVYQPEGRVTEIYAGRRLTLRWHMLRRIRNTQNKLLRFRETGEAVFQFRVLLRNVAELALRIPLLFIALPFCSFSHRVRRWVGATCLVAAPALAFLTMMIGYRFEEYR